MRVSFDDKWYGTEARFFSGAWRWSSGPSTVTIYNPQNHALNANITLKLSAGKNNTPCPLVVELEETQSVGTRKIPLELIIVQMPSVRLEPGRNILFLKTGPDDHIRWEGRFPGIGVSACIACVSRSLAARSVRVDH